MIRSLRLSHLLLGLAVVAYGPIGLDEGAPAPGSELEPQDEAPVLVSDARFLRGPRLRVTLFDIGQGDGRLVELPGGRRLVVDGGPDAERLLQLLQDRGVDQLDLAVLTHAHADHYAGLTRSLALLPRDCGRRVLDPGYDRPLASYQDFRAAAGCRYRQAWLGQAIPLDPSVQLAMLYASDELRPRDQSHGINNTSVVLRLRFHRFSMLLMGDAEAKEALWLDQGSSLRSTVLKVGHHGSCTATARRFLQAVAPRYVVMSVGRTNPFGLPHCQTMGELNALRGRGLRWARTDLNGTVSVVTDGYRYAVERARGAETQDDCPRDCEDPLEF